jgi:uncharacterized repeat protein (TIGR01451 family)
MFTFPGSLRNALLTALVAAVLLPSAMHGETPRQRKIAADQFPALSLNKEHTPDSGNTNWQLGVPIKYVITVTNGGVDNSHVSIKDSLPGGFVLTGVSCTASTGAGCPPQNTLVPPTFGEFSMQTGSKIVLEISGYYTSTGDKLNEAEAIAKDNAGALLPAGSATKDSDPILIPTAAVPWDLGIVKTGTAPDTVFPNALLHYTLKVTNNSPQAIYAGGIVKVRDVLRNNSSIPVTAKVVNYGCAPTALCPTAPTSFPAIPIGAFSSTSLLNLQWTGGNPGMIPANATFTIDFDVELTTASTCANGPVVIENSSFLDQANANTAISDKVLTNNTSATITNTITGLQSGCPPAPTFTINKVQTTGSFWDLTASAADDISYSITITNPNAFALTNVDLTDRIYKNAGTPPFTATMKAGPACPACSPALANIVLSAPTVTGDGYGAGAVLWKAQIPSIAPSQTVVITYTVGYVPVCESDPRGNVIYNEIVAAPSNAGVPSKSGYAAAQPPEAKRCDLDTEKRIVTPGPIQFGSTYKYDVFYRNTGSVARTVGTLRDTIMISSSTYGNIPFVYSVSCTGAGVTPLPSATNVPGTITNVVQPWLGTRLIDAQNVTFAAGSTLTCRVEILPQRPPDTNPFCQGAGEPKLVNAVYLDLSPNYNASSSTPPGFYNEVRTELPLCRKVSVTKTPSIKNFGPGTTFTYTIKVQNHGQDTVSGLTLTDAVPPPLDAVSASACNPATACPTAPAVNQGTNTVTVAYAPLAPGQVVTFDITILGPQAGGSYANLAAAAFVPGGNFYFQGDETKLLQNLANVTVVTPTLTKSFTSGKITYNGTSTLTFVITNTNSDPKQTGISFTDMLPPGLKIGSAVTSDCGGSVLVSSDGRSISLTGGQLVGPNSDGSGKHTCQITAKVTALGVCGVFVNNSKNFSNVVNLDVSNTEGKLEVVECPIGLVIQKNVVGAPAGWSGTFTFNVSCTGTPPIQKTATVQWPSPGFTTVTGIPRGSVCTVVEGVLPGPLPHHYSWTGSPVYSPGGGKVEITEQGGTVSVLNTIGTEETSCMRVILNEAVCEVDKNGRPTGRYVWRFRFQNLSGMPISHLYVAGLPSPVAAVPTEHVVFSPAVTGVSPLVEMVFANAQPGPIAFTVSLHDQTLECCSIRIEVELPPCDCAQLLTEVTPRCFPKQGGPPPPYKYTFTLQNFSPLLVENVLVTPVSPVDHLTPVATTAIAVDKGVHPVAPVPPGGTIGPITVSLSGPQAVGGKEVCLNLSLNTQDLNNCCSIVRCFKLPECSIVVEDAHPLGNATLLPLGEGFVIENIGATGNDGVAVDAGGARAAGFTWRPLDSFGPLPDGAFIELAAAGNSGDANGSLRVTQSEDGYRIRTSVAGAQSYRIDVFDAGQLVGTARNQSGINIIVIWPIAARAEVVEAAEDHPDETLGFTLDTERAVVWQLSDGSTLTGDRFSITPESSTGPVSLQRIELRAANIPRIEVTGVAIFNDCNGNGIADAEDIAGGTSGDENGNGVPDECEDAGDLDVSLNTGFDQATGTLLAPGADDEDWRVIVAGSERAAKVVVDPISVWMAPFSDSRWISAEAARGSSVGPQLTFERCFCISDDASEIALDLQLRADDFATVFLNGVRLADAGGAFNGTPLQLSERGGLGGSSPFRPGRNCLRIEVSDPGGVVTGLDLTGSVRATNGACETP